MGRYPLPQPINLSDSGPPPNENYRPWGRREFFQGVGSPEGVVLGDLGDEYTDIATGDVWRKLLNHGFKTGWAQTERLEGEGAPGSDLGTAGSTYWDKTNQFLYVKDSANGWTIVAGFGT